MKPTPKKKSASQNPDERKDRVFDIIVRSYIETAEPVGSRTISRRSNLNLSPASIRNVMADLEEAGFLKQPHTSAGRVPTDKGYRYWVDRLMERQELDEKEREWIRKELAKARTIPALTERISRVVTELTETAAMVFFKNLQRASVLDHLLKELMSVQKIMETFEENSELSIEGVSRIFEQPEFQDLGKMRVLLQAFDQKYDFIRIFVKDMQEKGVQVHIGRENTIRDLDDVSVVAKDCYVAQNAIGSIAAVGPTRMKYPKVVAVIEFVADTVTEELKRI